MKSFIKMLMLFRVLFLVTSAEAAFYKRYQPREISVPFKALRHINFEFVNKNVPKKDSTINYDMYVRIKGVKKGAKIIVGRKRTEKKYARVAHYKPRYKKLIRVQPHRDVSGKKHPEYSLQTEVDTTKNVEIEVYLDVSGAEWTPEFIEENQYLLQLRATFEIKTGDLKHPKTTVYVSAKSPHGFEVKLWPHRGRLRGLLRKTDSGWYLGHNIKKKHIEKTLG